MNWISIKNKLPPKPRTPYESYLVWATSGSLKTGIVMVIQFSRDENKFLPVEFFGEEIPITHWMNTPKPPKG